MEIRKVVCSSGRTYRFVNESWNNSTGWGHRSVMMLWNHYECSDVKIKYLNRTWEMYSYQTVMMKALRTYEEELKERFIENYKDKNNIIRFKSGEKDKVIEMFYETEDGKDMLEINKAIELREFAKEDE